MRWAKSRASEVIWIARESFAKVQAQTRFTITLAVKGLLAVCDPVRAKASRREPLSLGNFGSVMLPRETAALSGPGVTGSHGA